jgi:hypothetical protein
METGGWTGLEPIRRGSGFVVWPRLHLPWDWNGPPFGLAQSRGGLSVIGGAGRRRCQTEARIPLKRVIRPPDPGLETGSPAQMPVLPDAALLAAGAHDQAHETPGDRSVYLGASGRGEVSDDFKFRWHPKEVSNA